MSEDWSRREVEIIVADYFAMLSAELAGEPFNKAKHNANLQPLLRARSRGSIEFKHANISAVLIQAGYPYVDGYKPRSNYQELLRDVVLEHLASHGALQAAAERAVAAPVSALPALGSDWSSLVVAAPKRERSSDRVREGLRPAVRQVGSVNYLECEARNASLGAAGEEFIVSLERMRLWQLGHKRLSNKVEHVSQSQGDGLGYDILSFEPNGRERLIEVKTTRFGSMTPFFASRNEVEVSAEHASQYHLYRVFKFSKEPKVFILGGSLRESVVLDPMVFRATLP